MKAILFDLDGTLLPVTDDFFFGIYLKQVSQVIPGRTPEQVMHAIVGTMKAIMTGPQGEQTVEQAFSAGLEKRLDMPFERQSEHYLDYYQQTFPKLSVHITPRPQSLAAVKAARAKGYLTVLATNPVFPGLATRERMRWAGLAEGDFDHVTYYEQCRFTKPNPQYYIQEALGPLGIEAKDGIMIGNDTLEDMAPAHGLGMGTFLLNAFVNHPEVERCWDAEGDYDQMLAFIQALPEA